MHLPRRLFKVNVSSLRLLRVLITFFQAITETMSAELTPLGVKVLLVAPGSFRTEGIYGGQFPKDNLIPAYDNLREASIKRFNSIAGTEKGDPDKAMDLVVDVVRGEGKAAGRPWPLYLLLGEDAAANARNRANKVISDIEGWEDLTGKAVQFDELAS
jgi:NAD(P)-dependent dehydrogenase (short-subunit alcohol dehydrogenase family)